MDSDILNRIACALERLSPELPESLALEEGHGYVWHSQSQTLQHIPHIAHVPLSLLQGIDHVRDILLRNTVQFAQGYPANNALLWGARGMGKSSLVKAIHADVNRQTGNRLGLIEIHREDIHSLPDLLHLLSKTSQRILLFCDDLSFDRDDTSYKSLKAILDGGIAGRPENLLFYATSNRRHLMPRDMLENEQSTAIHPGEAVEEKVSLSDRFGLWLGFHSCDQATYLQMVARYAEAYKLPVSAEQLRAEAIEWAQTRGTRSGRVSWQFICDLAGRLEVTIK